MHHRRQGGTHPSSSKNAERGNSGHLLARGRQAATRAGGRSDTGTGKKPRVRRVTRQGIPGAAGMDSEGGPWVNGLPDVETREGP